MQIFLNKKLNENCKYFCTYALSGPSLCRCRWGSACSSLVSDLCRKKQRRLRWDNSSKEQGQIRWTRVENNTDERRSKNRRRKDEGEESKVSSERHAQKRARVWIQFFPFGQVSLLCIIYITESALFSLIICPSFFCLQTTAWPCPETDGPVCETAKKKKCTEQAAVQMRGSNIWQISVQSLHYSVQP